MPTTALTAVKGNLERIYVSLKFGVWSDLRLVGGTYIAKHDSKHVLIIGITTNRE